MTNLVLPKQTATGRGGLARALTLKLALAFALLAPALSAHAVEVPAPLPGQLSSRFRIDPKNPEASVPSTAERDKEPLEYGYLIQDLLTGAEQAKKDHDYAAVVLYYRAVAKAVPESAKGWSKLCEAYEVVNDRDRAIRACKYALERPAVDVQDYVRYVHLVLAPQAPMTREERVEADKVLKHLDQQPGLEAVAAQLSCEVAVKDNDIRLLERCTQVLAKRAPDDPRTIVFQWNLALQKGRQGDARGLVDRAQKAGVVQANVERMRKLTEDSGSRHGWQRVAWIAGLCALALIAAIKLFRRRRFVTQRLAP